MKSLLKLSLFFLPLLGLVLGYAYASLSLHGLFESWHFVGNPGEKIEQILGIREGRKLLVATESGRISSIELVLQKEVDLPLHPEWEEEQLDTVDPVSYKDWGANFVSRPPLFPVEQIYELEYLYKVEGAGLVKFALAENGNIWMWNHQLAGLAGLAVYFYPVIGLFLGLIVAMILNAGAWLIGRDRTPIVNP